MKKLVVIFIILILGISGCAKVELKESYGSPTNNITLEEKLVVHFLDVGQADSIFIELPNDRTMLIDAGVSGSSEKIINYIESLNYTTLDYVIGTHPHADHIGGLSKVIENFDIGNIYMPKAVATSKTYENLLTTISDKNLKIKTGKAGIEVIKEDNLEAVMVAPNSDKYSSYNNYSIILKLTYGNTSYLFTGDAEELSENEITSDIDVDVLKVGHHGSDTSSSEEFLEKVTPNYAVISVGEDNKYDHPASETITKLKKYTKNIYRTDEDGDIIITSDGASISVETEK